VRLLATIGRRRPLTCRELVELVTEYLEGALSPRDQRRFEDHIADCPYCTNYLEQMRVTIRTLGRIEEESLSQQARDELLAAFRDWRSEPDAVPPG
jgi:anti-sigma factor RsiW